MSLYTFHSWFAGLWPLVWHFGGAAILIGACLAWAWAMPVFRKTALWIALAIFVYLVGLTVGVKDEHARNSAKAAVLKSHVEDVVRSSRDPRVRGLPDKFDIPD